MQRFVRRERPNASKLVDEDFDPAVHKVETAPKGAFPLERCFDAAEEVVDKDASSLTLIQNGAQQAIFLVRTASANLVVGVCMQTEVNEMVRVDHEGITRMREEEVQAGAVPSFPRHLGGWQTAAGPFVHLSEFCEDFVEVNAHFVNNPNFSLMGDTTERYIVLNAHNQGGYANVLKEPESTPLFSKVAEHQLRTAVRSQKVLAPTFKAGDYMLHPDGRLMLQCYRAPKFSEFGHWGNLADHLTFDENPRLLTAALQLLHLITVREQNLLEPREGETFFTYSALHLSSTVSRLREDKDFLSSEEWSIVFVLMRELIQWIQAFPVSRHDQARLIQRAYMLTLLLRHG